MDGDAEHTLFPYFDIQLWFTFKEMFDWIVTLDYGIKEMLRLPHDTCGYQKKRMIDTCICQINPKKLYYYIQLLHMLLYCMVTIS